MRTVARRAAPVYGATNSGSSPSTSPANAAAVTTAAVGGGAAGAGSASGGSEDSNGVWKKMYDSLFSGYRIDTSMVKLSAPWRIVDGTPFVAPGATGPGGCHGLIMSKVSPSSSSAADAAGTEEIIVWSPCPEHCNKRCEHEPPYLDTPTPMCINCCTHASKGYAQEHEQVVQCRVHRVKGVAPSVRGAGAGAGGDGAGEGAAGGSDTIQSRNRDLDMKSQSRTLENSNPSAPTVVAGVAAATVADPAVTGLFKRLEDFMRTTERRLDSLAAGGAAGGAGTEADGVGDDISREVGRMYRSSKPAITVRGGAGGGGGGAVTSSLRSAARGAGRSSFRDSSGDDNSRRPDLKQQQQQQLQRDRLRVSFDALRSREDDSHESSDSDSGGSDDASSRGGHGRSGRRAKAGGGQVVESILAGIDEAGSARSWVRTNEFRSERNRHECESIAHAVDSFLLLDGLSRDSYGLEVLLRRLAGVALADEHGSWGAADAVSAVKSSRSLLPRRQVIKALKEASAFNKLKSGAATSVSFGSAGLGDQQSQYRGKKSKNTTATGSTMTGGGGTVGSWRSGGASGGGGTVGSWRSGGASTGGWGGVSTVANNNNGTGNGNGKPAAPGGPAKQ